jgi:syntaxin-binding protein 5
MMEQMKSEERQLREAERAGPSSSAQLQQGYWSSMQQSLAERTQRLNIVSDSMDRLEETSAGWANDVSKFVEDQKRKAALGCKFSTCILHR